MNWQLISSLILFAIISLSFLFYEKKTNSEKEIALMASMAALAGISRVPFASIPNVQPTTFIVMISGWVFGPFFGFMTGCISTLVSNMFLGHGPWTPWQMVGWGLCGFIAGIFGKSIKTPNRFVCGTLCFSFGFLFGLVMNMWQWLFFVHTHNLRSFLAVLSTSFAFDFIHAIGNFAFAFFLSEEFLLILLRFKRRLSFKKIK